MGIAALHPSYESACATPGSVLAFPIGDEAGSPSDGPPSKLCAHSTCRGWRMDASVTDIATEPKPSTGNALIRLLYVARGLRGFGDGFAVIILPAYMTALGYDAIAVGIVATASLLGTALLTLITGWIAPRHDLRALLIFGAGLMAATGLAFPAVEHFVLDRAGRVHRHHQSLRRRSRRAGSARACGAGEERDRRPTHAGVCALQPDRGALHRRRLAGGNACPICWFRTAAPCSPRSA